MKAVNDDLGHRAGDKLLRAVCAAMTDRLRESDAVGRLGGDEFAILLLDLDEAVALRVANDLLERVRAIRVDTPRGCGWTTASVEIAYVSSFAGLESDQLIERADQAMYLAKKCGGDRAEPAPWPALVG